MWCERAVVRPRARTNGPGRRQARRRRRRGQLARRQLARRQRIPFRKLRCFPRAGSSLGGVCAPMAPVRGALRNPAVIGENRFVQHSRLRGRGTRFRSDPLEACPIDERPQVQRLAPPNRFSPREDLRAIGLHSLHHVLRARVRAENGRPVRLNGHVLDLRPLRRRRCGRAAAGEVATCRLANLENISKHCGIAT